LVGLVDKKSLEAKLAGLMDSIAEIEGLFALDGKGNLIIGQTLLETDKAAIAKAAFDTFNKAKDIGKNMTKGGVQSLIVNLDKGSSCIVGDGQTILVSMQGDDASTSIALILRSMKSILG